MKPELLATPDAHLTTDIDPALDATRYQHYKVIKRNGKLTPFDPQRIVRAMTKAFMAIEGKKSDAIPERIHKTVNQLTHAVITALSRRLEFNGTVHIEDIQDQVELELMRAGEHKVARDYVLYREQHAQQRAHRPTRTSALNVSDAHGSLHPLDETRLFELVAEACAELDNVSAELVVAESLKNLYDGIPAVEVNRVLVMTARMLIEKEPDYTFVAARLLLDTLRSQALEWVGEGLMPTVVSAKQMSALYTEYFPRYLKAGIAYELLSPALAEFDLARLTPALKPERDCTFTYLGFQTLYDRYFLHWDEVRFELPQAFFMRVAMGLALNEIDREARAIEFYELLSNFDFMSSTPTLFNSGTCRSQLSSCYLSTVPDDLHGIYGAIHDNAMLQKFAGGLGNDWTRVRAMGARIKGTNGKSQGVVPFLKVANDTLVAVNQCFAPDTQVFTAQGVKAIKDIQVGDLVLGKRGEYRTVKQKLAYNQFDDMLELNIKHAIETIKVTSGHPFWAIKGLPLEQSIERSMDWLEKGKVKADWIDAGKLEKGDYVAQVIPQEVVPVAGFIEDDARLYGIMLGDGHCSKQEKQWGMKYEWGVSGNPNTDTHLSFVRNYLEQRGIHYWTEERENYLQLRWANSQALLRDATTGQFVAGEANLPFTHEDLYNADKQKRIAPRFSHLPKNQTLALLQGLIETDGGISRDKEVYFTNTSVHLIEGVRYQCLRLGVPVAGQYRERDNSHTSIRADGTEIQFKDISKSYDLRIPAIAELAERVNCQPLTKYNWINWQGCVFTRIKSTQKITSIPFIYDLKVEGDHSYMTTSALVHNGGRRRGSGCAYLETWHLDIEEFLELRKNTGDERRRTHDLNTASWIPDLFMRRVSEQAEWTLFSPDEVSDLHDLYGSAFEMRYLHYEEQAATGKLRQFKKISALQLWRKMLTMLFETGHPWLTFKDPCNIRSPQQHVGVVHSSNLCCIAADQRVVTARGMLTIGELYQLGGENKVIGLDGVYNASEMLLPRPNAPMVELNTKEGYTHKVTPDHKVWVKDKGWVEVQDLKENDLLLIQQLEGLWGKEHNPKLSYVMGLIAGDGTFGKSNVFIDIWEQDYQYIEEVELKVHTLLEGNTALNTTSTNQPVFRYSQQNKHARLASAPLRRLLADHGFTPETKTTIPQLVWAGNKETVGAYLRGLYQADGHIQASKEVTTLVLASKDLKFIQDLQILWANFGVKSSINQMRQHQWHDMPDGKGGYKKYWSKPLYRLLITSIQGCRIAESILHLSEQKDSEAAEHFAENIQKTGYAQKMYAHFTGLTTLPNEDAYCLMVDSDTHAWTVNGMVTKNTEITLNTSDEEIAVCNLASINLANHTNADGLDTQKLARTVKTAMRMLDNVIDINYYAVPQARRSNLRHRPVGLGIMGFQDALYIQRIPCASEAAVAFADQAMEIISYQAIQASADLAEERGKYPTFDGSLWSQGILPIDSLQQLKAVRGDYFDLNTQQCLDWNSLRQRVQEVGMRNSNCMAIAPTATISNICGVTQSIEPTYQNLFVKSNLSGEFTVINPYLVRDLKALGLWDETMVNDLKYFDGSVQGIERVPSELKALYATAFEIDPQWLVESAARRQKWIDQSQSLNLYMRDPSGTRLDELYRLAWIRGLKTTYYLRSLSATSVEKNTVQKSDVVSLDAAELPNACLIDDPECEACQ